MSKQVTKEHFTDWFMGNDNNLDTKWLDFNKFTLLVLDFGTLTEADGYRLATANDSEERDPVSWRVEGSAENLTWETLNEQANYATPTARKTYLRDFPIGPLGNGPAVSFTANPSSILVGASSTLTWSVANVTWITIDNGIGSVASGGSTNVSPAGTSTYTLTATNSGGTSIRSVQVAVVTGFPLTYNFDDGTFQGWTDLTAGSPPASCQDGCRRARQPSAAQRRPVPPMTDPPGRSCRPGRAGTPHTEPSVG